MISTWMEEILSFRFKSSAIQIQYITEKYKRLAEYIGKFVFRKVKPVEVDVGDSGGE
jgi:hypothetical protein